MNYLDQARIAFVHLRERKRQTILTALGVAVGSAMLVTTISVARGSSSNVIAKVIDTAPHVLISAERVVPLIPENLVRQNAALVAMVTKNITLNQQEVIKNYTGVVESIRPVEELRSISPFVLSKLLARNKTRFTACVARGVVPRLEADIAGLQKNLIEKNSLEELAYTPNGILLGDLLAKKLNAGYRDRIVLVTKNSEEFPVTIVGRFSSGFNVKDEREAYVNLSLAQRMEGIASNSVTGIGLRTAHVERAARLPGKFFSIFAISSTSAFRVASTPCSCRYGASRASVRAWQWTLSTSCSISSRAASPEAPASPSAVFSVRSTSFTASSRSSWCNS